MGKERKRPLKPKPLLEPVAEDGSEGKLARALGSVDYHTRERGLQAVALWLSRRQEISELEMAKLWKGIFYAFWHSDKQPVQVGRAAAAHCASARRLPVQQFMPPWRPPM